MADPKKGYKKGVYRTVTGTVDSSGNFSITNIPQEGWVAGVFKLTTVTIDAAGDTSAAEDDIGLNKYITVTVDSDGILSVTDVPQEGYVKGVYRVTTDTDWPQEGRIDPFTGVVGTITSSVWTAT